MTPKTIILTSIILIILALSLAILIYAYNVRWRIGEGEEAEKTACTELGCPGNTMYVGSKNSDKYYECSCGWAKNIKSENLVCFKSGEEAEGLGYVLREC